MQTMTDDIPDVNEDPALSPEEKQVSLVTTKGEDYFRVHSEVTSVTRYLLKHPSAEIDSTREVDGSVVACTAKIPHGLVKLQGKPRKSDQFSQVVSQGKIQGKEDNE